MNKLLILLLILTVVNTCMIAKHMQLWDIDCNTDQECEDLGYQK
jgi:hypothetical protein